MVLAGCSTGGGDDAGDAEPRQPATTVDADGSVASSEDEADPQDDEQAVEATGDPVSHLPFDGEAPDGYRMVSGDCEANAEAQAAAEEAGEYDYASPLVFTVPDTWTGAGKGSGGSGGIVGTDVDLTYRTAASDEVEVAFEWDERGPNGEIYDIGEPWTSFDYDYVAEDVTTVIEYEKVATVDIEDQSVDIFYRDPSQAPDLVDGHEYKARVSTFDLPNSLLTPDGVDQYSVVFAVTFGEDTTEVDQAAVEAIIGSVNLPTCVWDDLLAFEEVTRQTDLNGDGEVKSMEEWQAELMADLEAEAGADE